MKLLEYLSFGMLACIITGVECQKAEVFVEEGSLAILPCRRSSMSQSNPYVQWTKEHKGTVWRMQQSGLQYWGSEWSNTGNQRIRCPHAQFSKGEYSLHINRVTEEDGGLYFCYVNTGDTDVKREIMLRIIKVSFSPSVPISGKDVSLTCGVTPRFELTSVKWMLNNSPFVPQRGNHPNGDTRIVKQKATMSSSGNWTCVVNYNGIEGRASAYLPVQGIIQPLKDDTKLYAAVGSAATFPCVFSSGVKPLSSAWEKLKQGSRLTPAVGHLPSSFDASSAPTQLPWDKSATLNEVSFEHEGKYRCAGTIEKQRMTRTMQLVVAKIVPSQKGSSVTLTCQLSDATEVTKYEWVPVMYDHNGTESEGPTHEGKTVSLSSVSEEQWSEWTCRFYGEKGLLGNVTHHTAVMSGLFGQESSGNSKKTATIIGLFFLLVALLLVLFQLYKNHQRRKRIFQYPALETIVHTVSNEREKRERSREKL